MRLILLCLIASTCYAQTISGLRIALDESSNADVGPNCVRFEYAVSGLSGSSTFAIDAGTTTSLGATLPDFTSSDNDTYYRYICHAQASETWYYRLSVDAVDTDCPVTCTDCTSTDDSLFAADSNGINCTTGEPFRITHPAAGTRTPTAPAAPSDTNPYDDCDADGTPTSTTCGNLATDLSTLAGTAGTHLVEIPPGTCNLTSQFTLPTLTSADRICIRPELSDADLRPTAGTQAATGNRSRMVVFRHTDPYVRADFTGSPPAVMSIPSGYTLTDIVVEEQPTVPNPLQATITAYSGMTTVALTCSTDCPAEFDAGSLLVLNMPGLTAYDSVVRVTSASGTTVNVVSATSFAGTLGGNGTATMGSIPISGAADNGSGAIRITTAVAHGLPADANYDGSDTLYVHNVQGTTEANGRFLFSVVDATNVDLTGSTFSNTYSASDYDFLRLNSLPASSTIDASDTTGVRLGRVLVGNASPHYQGQLNQIDFQGATDFVVRDSILYGGMPMCPVSVTDGLPDCENYGSFNGGYLRGDGVRGLYVYNNLMVGSGGIGLEFNSTNRTVHDVTIQRNHIIATDRPCPDTQANGYFPGSLNYYQDNRHLSEFKTSCYRCLITENYFKGACVSEDGRTGYAVALFNTESTGGISGVYRQQDVDVTWNYFEDVASAFGISSQNNGETRDQSFHNRIRFSNNFVESSGYEVRQSPRSLTLSGTSSSQSGAQIVARSGTQYFDAKNNTFYRATGLYAGAVVNYQGDKIPECEIENNIFTFHRNASVDEGFNRFTPSLSDYDETSNLTEFDKVCPGGSFASNLLIAGVEDGEDVSANKNSELDANTVTSAEMNTAWPNSGSFSTINRGPTDASYSARHIAVFGSDQTPTASYTSYGVSNLSTLRQNVFREVLSLDATQVGTTLTFTWTAPTTTGCTVRLTDDSWSTASKQTDVGGDTAQTVSFTVGSGAHEAWVECDGAKPAYWSKTL